MTFDRFIGIIMPHKAASRNTVKRAKITIVCSCVLSILFNIPHLFMMGNVGRQCIPLFIGMDKVSGQLYYWLSFTVSFALPFILLLVMNCFIIQTVRISSMLRSKMDKQGQDQSQHKGQIQGQGKDDTQGQGHGQNKDKNSNTKNTEKQMFAILLLVTFGFLILTTPSYVFFLYVKFYDYTRSPGSFAFFHLFSNIANKMYFTNYGINFYLYVISGAKFRADLVKLFRCKKEISNVISAAHSSESITRTSHI